MGCGDDFWGIVGALLICGIVLLGAQYITGVDLIGTLFGMALTILTAQ